MYILRIYTMLSEASGSLPSIDQTVLERTAKLLRDRHADVAKVVDTMEAARVSVIEARAVVASLRTMMLDVTFDDSYLPADVAELSELFERWRGHLNRAVE